MHKGTVYQFIAELEDKIDELKGDSSVTSSKIIDTGEDVIEADEHVEEFEEFEDEVEDTSETLDVEDNDHAKYLTGLYQSVEQELEDLAQGVAWSSDEDNIYMDVNFADGHVFTFTIPKADLAYDIDNMGKDIDYICVAVRDVESQDDADNDSGRTDSYAVPPEDVNYDMSDYYSDEDRPAYV